MPNTFYSVIEKPSVIIALNVNNGKSTVLAYPSLVCSLNQICIIWIHYLYYEFYFYIYLQSARAVC